MLPSDESLQLSLPRGLSTWQRFAPFDAWRDDVLRTVAAWLDEPQTRAQLDYHESNETYPAPVVSRLRELGIAEFFAPRCQRQRLTMLHICALNALTARRDTSLAVTLSVNALGLLPVYLAGTAPQLDTIAERVEAGAFAALLLSEWSHGSNILRNQARAVRGRLNEHGVFTAVADDQPCTCYELSGEKTLINGATQHDLLSICVRTRGLDTQDPTGEVRDPLRARGAFSLFWLERGKGMTPLPRYYTMPARAADISGLRLNGCVVEAERLIGPEHGGMPLVHQTLMVSRGGVASLASGCVTRAAEIARAYAESRNIYGYAIAKIGGVAEHLVKLDALDRLAAALALKAAAFLNSLGVAASHYATIAKIMACAYAEQGVREGQRVLGARSLLRDFPYERLIRDVSLYGIFDGTTDVMLNDLSTRLLIESRRDPNSDGGGTIEQTRACYLAPAANLLDALRQRRRQLVMPLAAHFRALDGLDNSISLEPLAIAADVVFWLVRHLEESRVWQSDQALRLSITALYAELEALASLVELCDSKRRAKIGLPAMSEPDPRDEALYAYALTWRASHVLAELRVYLLQQSGEGASTSLSALESVERRMLRTFPAIRSACGIGA